ncbi:MAG TPA: UDP-N-acetylmuramoyl-L-alanyl-D-glutamate--2,6-diaminopimelate ligase [Phycisphaerae bacterium]|jgi:UDP-N-acetylmuramoyl-L-alanyl-D-glutamate--2,6-diaminopimelate ligase|nr:UDP-N-acetylmuramoyl-L-alanyl-D-glutamate--2,6-diaminopimelate ligase [Phycisphaerae bacterium]
MKFSELIEKVRGRGVAVAEMRAQSDPEILGIAEDSRKVRPGDLFVARAGTKANGTQFVDEAFAKGAVAVVLQEDVGLPCATAWARVADINFACAILAHEVAGNPTAPPRGMKMIGITGTKGKTTVAYLLRSVLKAAGHRVGMIGTVEIDDGVKVVPAEMTTPGSVELVELFSRMKANGVTHCVMEVSSHALHQHRVAGIDFAVGIFTNLTGDHLDYHKTMEEYAAAKAMLFEGLKEGAVAVINGDDKWAKRMIRGCAARVVRYHQALPVGLPPEPLPREEGDWSCWITSMTSEKMEMEIEGPGEYCVVGFESQLVGRHNVYNLLSVVVAGKSLDISDSILFGSLAEATGAPGRLQRVKPASHDKLSLQVFVDYAHTHDALENVLRALRTTMGQGSNTPSAGDIGGTPMPQLICLFGCGGDRDRTKRPKMGAIAERLADKVIVTSDNPRTEEPGAILEEICAGFSAGWKTAGKVTVEPDRRAAIRAAIGMAKAGDVVLLAGKGHENYQIIGTTKHHFDDVEEAERALEELRK